MLNSLAKVFATSGTVWETTGYRYGQRQEVPAPKGVRPGFAQESYRLELRHSEKSGDSASSKGNLDEAEQEQVEKLKQRDAEVRRHEQAHVAAASGHARGGAKFELEKGPDGRSYAVSGHVEIDTSSIPGNPEATYQKAQTLRRAALAPGDPSGADRAVASQAAAMAYQAQKEMSSRTSGGESPGKSASGTASRGSLDIRA
jgi:hypothetical protein